MISRLPETTTKTVEGRTRNEAKSRALREIPPNGRLVKIDVVVLDAAVRQITVQSPTSHDDAVRSARESLPPDADVIATRSIQREQKGSRETASTSEQEAIASAIKVIPTNAKVVSVSVDKLPKKGFLGFGRSLGIYSIHWQLNCILEIKYLSGDNNRYVATVIYRVTRDQNVGEGQAILHSPDDSESIEDEPPQTETFMQSLRSKIPREAQEGIFGKGDFKLVDETPDYKIRVGDEVRYCGSRRTVGESGKVLEAYTDGACVVQWAADRAISLLGDHLVSRN